MKNQQYNSLLIAVGISILTLLSCKKDFKEINTNPNAPIEVQPSLLLRQVIYDYGEQMSYEGFVAGNLLGQYFTAIDFNLFDRHSLTEPQFGGNPWPVIYKNLRDNEIMLQQAQSSSINAVYEGPALILKAYMAAALTDIYGDVPYFEALKGNQGTITPAYDSQEMIYTAENGIIDNLNKAISLLENYSGNQSLEGDILFNGDLNGWIKFANSLKIKYLLRIVDRSDQAVIANQLQKIADGQEFINDNLSNAAFDFTDGQPNNFRMANLRSGDFNLFVMSQTMDEILKELDDPRIATFYRPIGKDTTESIYGGLLNGPDASTTSISVADYSLTGRIFRENTGALDANFMTAWETLLLLAEAAQRGLISGSAQNYYENGVRLAFEYWNTPLPGTYLTTGGAAFNNNGLEQIITQKWIASSTNGYEGWIEYRRTGFPQLKTISASLNNDLIPVRMPYPTDESALNSINFNAATAQNQNSINAPVWWDVN